MDEIRLGHFGETTVKQDLAAEIIRAGVILIQQKTFFCRCESDFILMLEVLSFQPCTLQVSFFLIT